MKQLIQQANRFFNDHVQRFWGEARPVAGRQFVTACRESSLRRDVTDVLVHVVSDPSELGG